MLFKGAFAIHSSRKTLQIYDVRICKTQEKYFKYLVVSKVGVLYTDVSTCFDARSSANKTTSLSCSTGGVDLSRARMERRLCHFTFDLIRSPSSRRQIISPTLYAIPIFYSSRNGSSYIRFQSLMFSPYHALLCLSPRADTIDWLYCL